MPDLLVRHAVAGLARNAIDAVSGRFRPWLILGKGPSLDRIDRVDLAQYYLFSLNHACRLVPSDGRVVSSVAHFTDIEALADCAADLEARRPDLLLCLPWYPHEDFRPGRRNLAALGREHPVLAAYAGDSRLLSYNSTLARALPANPYLPTVRVRYFSAVAAFNLLVAAGCREVHSLGLDGGTDYAAAMDPKDRLANGRRSFSDQFLEIGRTCRRTGARLVRLQP